MNSYIRCPPDGLLNDCVSDKKVLDNFQFDGSDILYIWDTIDELSLSEMLKQHGTPKYIVNDSFSYFDYPGINVYCVNKWLEWQLSKFETEIDNYQHNFDTLHCANFCINKKQLNRYLAMKMVEIFEIDCCYTWSGFGKNLDCTKIINEKNSLSDKNLDRYWGEILSPIQKFEKKWIHIDNTDQDGSSFILNYGQNCDTWKNGLDKVFSTSAVSLITESGTATQAIHFSEKTAYAIMGLTFPIWVGGQNQANEWKKIGFDIFEDIIDHSYQHKSTVIEQCFYAIYNNLELLQDIKKLSALRLKHRDRLIKNRNHLSYATFKKYNKEIVSTWPVDLQEIIAPLFKKYIIE